MNKYESWLEEYKHLTGAHNQKAHGRRGGTKMSQEAISGLNSKSQIIYDGLSERDKVKFRLAWYRELKKSGGSDADAFTKSFLEKNTASAPAKVQPKAAVPATPVQPTNAPAPAPAKSTVFDFGHTKVDVSEFQTKKVKLAGVNDSFTQSTPNRTVLSYDIKKTNRKDIKDISDIRDIVSDWRAKNKIFDGYITGYKRTGQLADRNGVDSEMYKFSMWDSGGNSTARYTGIHGPTDREIVFEFWMPI